MAKLAVEISAFRPPPPTIPLVREQAWRVQIAVAHVTGVPLKDLYSPRRHYPRAAFARQVAMYLCHVAYGMNLKQVGFAFGRHRSTVCHAFRRIEQQRDDPELDRTLCWLEAMLRRDGRLM